MATQVNLLAICMGVNPLAESISLKDGPMDETEVRKTFSANLRQLRAERGFSQLALSSKTGLSHNFINDIENGKKWVSPQTLALLSEALEVEVYRFFISSPIEGTEQKKLLDEYIDDLSRAVLKAVKDAAGRYRPDSGL